MFDQNYIEYVKRTANPNYTLEMAACALMEEWQEYSEKPSIDELGDVFYQFVLFATLTGSDMKFEYDDECLGYKGFIESILSITTQYKKLVTRGKQLNLEAIKDALNFIYSDIRDAVDFMTVTFEWVEEFNMRKLDRRYNVESETE